MPRKRSSSHVSKAGAKGKKLSAGAWVAIATTVMVICGSLAAYGVTQDLYGNLNQENIDTDAFGDRPSKVEGALNILIVGSDIRDGENSEYGSEEGERPDTLAIAHVSPDQKSATLVNLPRDSIVQMPECPPTDDRPGQDAHEAMIGEAMNSGGMQCLWKTVEQLTEIHIDHFVKVDFVGFKDMVDAIGGIPVCVPEPIDDPDAGHLKLEAGEQTLDGEEALGYVRSRKGQGDGSDLSRIDRQQEFMGAMLKKVMSSEVLARPTSLYDFLGSVTEHVTTDDELNVDSMADIAIAMREVELNDVNFVTVPNGQHPADPNRITWTEPDATELFNAVAADEGIDGGDDSEGGEDDSDSGGGSSEAPSVEPGEVSVEIINATDIQGLANEVSTGLTSEGFQVLGTGNPEGDVPQQTTVYYGAGNKAHAEAVADVAANATTEEHPALADNVQLVLSNDWNGFGDGGGGGGDAADVDSTSAADAKVECE
ncbi:LCP family protein required for cell wall assembly [Lipingzhangella halophila]|uniref:LCP family protein required for cell wall assembly n=1 Tax=Lipingzhangella halophila TaxID=1783352 RepID=A0A7W7W4T2_9ACTN|nr:LCP family protein [Lipingzhangella halophila]MBB4933928.1 LCP family protein required for cell wall assembly [Lipingzhangella halophila]